METKTAFQHYNYVIMSAMASQIISLTIVYSTAYSDADQRIYQSPGSLAFVQGIHWWPMNSAHKGPVTRKMFLFDDVTMGIYMKHDDTTIADPQPRKIWPQKKSWYLRSDDDNRMSYIYYHTSLLSPTLKLVRWTPTTPYIANRLKKVIHRTKFIYTSGL